MKKTLILGILGLAATALSTYGQGVIVLDNYDSSGPLVTYGAAGIPANGTGGAVGTVGSPLQGSTWTVEAYYVAGTVSIPVDATHTADPATLGLAIGTGSSVAMNSGNVATSSAGYGYFKGGAWAIPGSAAAGGATYTLEIAAYNGASYDTSGYRGHSEAFTMVTSANSNPSPNATGTAMPAFSVYPTPEPSVFALSAIGAAALMLRRRKS